MEESHVVIVMTYSKWIPGFQEINAGCHKSWKVWGRYLSYQFTGYVAQKKDACQGEDAEISVTLAFGLLIQI